MGYLLDTCAISELHGKSEHPNAVRLLTNLPREETFLSALSIGEIQRGLETLPPSRKRDELSRWFFESVLGVFQRRILPFDTNAAMRWGTVRGELIRKGKTMQVTDSMIAATCLSHGHMIVTQNEKDFANCGVVILNPWK